MSNTCFRQAYDILSKVYKEGTYLNLLMKENTSSRVAKIVYGVMEKYYELNYIIDSLTTKNTKQNIRTFIQIAGYCLIYLDTPLNVVLNETHEVMDEIGKTGVKGFVDALIQKIDKKEYSMPKKNDKRYTEVKYNMPSFLVGMYKKDYPNTYEEIINAPFFNKVHIRAKCSEEEIFKADKDAIKTLTGYYVNNTREISFLNFSGEITYMSYASTLVAESIKLKKGQKVCDVCAAPGGKAVFLTDKGYKVTACDIHSHRVQLIIDYANRMRTKLDKIYTKDALLYDENFEKKFDAVLVDAPCSGLGVIEKKRDVLFNRTYDDIISLAALQQEILQNAKNYVALGGLLVYSTCTVFSAENGNNVKKFLETNPDFVLEKIDLPFENNGEIQFLPDGKGMEGFYLCHMRRL